MMKKITQTLLLPLLFFSLSTSSVLAVCVLGFDGGNQIQTHNNLVRAGFSGLSAIGQATYNTVIADVCTAGTEFAFVGDRYRCVTNPTTNREWLDRNLGADDVCVTKIAPDTCYGDLYQWGRNKDGHEQRTANTQEATIPYTTTDNANFITALSGIVSGDWASADDSFTLRQARWSALDGSGVCPIGFRVPTRIEFRDERASWLSDDEDGAFRSALKLPIAGFRLGRRGGSSRLSNVREVGSIWGTDIRVNNISYLNFSRFSADHTTAGPPFHGRAVRCIKSTPEIEAADLIINTCIEFSLERGGADADFTFAGNEYACLHSRDGKLWFDRNLGADNNCGPVYTKESCYGDRYQWGRNKDGHEKRTSSISPTRIPYTTTDNANFISGTDWASADDAGTERVNRWSQADGGGVCPTGFRVPTIAELNTIVDSTDHVLPFSGIRKAADGLIEETEFSGIHFQGGIWSSSIDGGQSSYVYSGNVRADFIQEDDLLIEQRSADRATGLGIRCLLDR